MIDITDAAIPPDHQLRVVLPGGTGHLGRILARHFHRFGHRVTVLARTPKAAPWQVMAWDGASLGRWVDVLEDADMVINLAGRSVDCRYGAANRREIMESRLRPTMVLGHAMAKLSRPPRLWMNASTATIYRHSLNRAMDEMSGELGGSEDDVPPAWRFSIEVATRWEASFFQANTPETRKIVLRSAMVMSAERGGPFETLRLVRFGLGGSGRLGGAICLVGA